MKIGLGINIFSNQVLNSFSAEYTSILTVARTGGYTLPNVTEQKLQNKLIVDLKTAGIWAKLDAFYMFCNGISTDSTGAFARINWKNPTANYGTIQSPGTALPPYSAKNGFTANQSAGINLNFNPLTAGLNFNSSNASLGVYVGVIPIGISPAVFGSITGGSNQARVRNAPGTSGIASSTVVSTYKDNQFIHINRTETAGPFRTIQAFIDGVSAGTTPATAAWTLTDTAWSLFYNGTSFGGTTQVRIGFIGGNLAAEASSFRSILRNYFISLFATTNYLTDPTNLTTANWFKDSGVSFTHFASGGVGNQPYDNFTSSSYIAGIRVLQEFTSQPKPIPNGTFSVYLKGSGSVRLGIYANGNTIPNPSITLTTNWRQYSVTRTDLIDAYMHPTIFFDGSSINCDICYSQFEATTIANPLP